MPDALSKTIPIWCATINNAVRKRALLDQRNQHQKDQEPQKNVQHASHDVVVSEDQGSITRICNDGVKESNAGDTCVDDTTQTDSLLIPALDANKWDTRYHSLPSLISRSEHAQIAEKIDGFAEKLMVKGCFHL